MADTMNLEKMKVADLRDELEKRGLDTKGTKPFLVSRLQDALDAEAGAGGGADMDMDSNNSAEPAESPEEEEDEPMNDVENGVMENGAVEGEEVDEQNGVHDNGDVAPAVEEEQQVEPVEVHSTERVEQAMKDKSDEPKVEPKAKVLVAVVPVVKVEYCEKAEPGMKVEPVVKDEYSEKAEPVVKVEPAEKVVSVVKVEYSEKAEPGMKVKPAVKVEPDVKVEPAVKVEPTVKVELAEKVESAEAPEEAKIEAAPEAVKKVVSEPEKGIKRKFGETGLTAEELTPWTIREDEPELSDDFLCLDWYNSDLNLRIAHNDFLSGMPLNKESWSWIYGGVRATHGVTAGKVFFEVTCLDTLRVWTDKDGFHLDLRVGWSTNSPSRQLGEDAESWCYSSAEGKKATNKEFLEYGAKFEKGDVIGAFLDMGEENVAITFTKNGESQGEAYVFPRASLGGKPLFPHILSRNIKFTCNFGKDKEGKEMAPFKTPLEEYTQIALADPSTLVRGDPRIKTREECEFILMVGLPAAGKTTWAKKFAAEHPEKKYEILNASVYLEKATVNGESRKTHTDVSWEKVHHRITKAIQDILKTASTRRRNIILDQTNVYVDAQLRKARPFEKMQRRCVVVVPTHEDWERRIKLQEEEGERNIPEDAVNEMKANIAFPNEGNGIFEEIIFTELQREDAQKQLEEYNQTAKDAGFGKKHLEYQSQWEMNKKMRGFPHSNFGRGMPRFPRGGQGFFRGGPPMMRGGPRMMRGGWGGAAPYGYAGPQGYGGGFGGGNWGPYGGGGARGGYGQYPGNRNWGGFNH